MSVSVTERKNRALRPATLRHVDEAGLSALKGAGLRVLIVDLNNFTSFPTLAVGLLTASLRNQGHRVDLLSPLSYNVPAVSRERPDTLIDHVVRRVHLTDWEPVVGLRDILRGLRQAHNGNAHPIVLREVKYRFEQERDDRPQVILLSAYLQHYESVKAIAAIGQKAGIPTLLGGPMFNLKEVAAAWRDIPGLTAVVGAEVDRDLPAIVEAACSGGNLLTFPGVVLPDGRASTPATPLRNLDATPVPDFTDFPWDRYPVRIVPMMTGRGCQWDKCMFCSDVISTSGRTFRTRSVDSVLSEMQEQARRHGTTNFLFLDLKLNSWPDMIRGIAGRIDHYVHGAEWVGTVHVDGRRDNGLSRSDLDLAVKSGMRRVSFGLESGSQRLLDLMKKGSTVAGNAQFIRDAHAAGLSVRCTMFKGFPGEIAEDMIATADFLERHAPYLDRVRFNDFTLNTGTPIWRAMQDKAGAPLDIKTVRDRYALSSYRLREKQSRIYRQAKARALATVYDINRQPLRDSARQFDGLM